MSAFIYLFRTTLEEQQQAMGTPEQAQLSMQAWLEWVRGLEIRGHLKDPGQPLAPTGKVVRGQGLVTDGPFIEAKDLVLGFMVIEAADMDEAVRLVDGCPMIGGAATVEVRPVGFMPA